ncbi:MAG: bifunctional precorrin-2 dehydrogenase/sirohydrochlorin ferrochelatase [Chloroflexi bacterium]|nr:bifunctional precorrin-2 dehydrogenase/sirohydrochlorin ferrochelatase [Chloroflexota bacterium]
MPAYYPIFLNLKGRRCVVIGGGDAQAEKVERLLECEASVVVVSETATDEVAELAEQGKLTWIQRKYQPGDLADTFIAISTAEDRQVDEQVAKEADERNVPLNVVDVTHLCSWITPAVAKRGPVTIAASTGGASPALARKLRELLNGSPVESGHKLLEYADLAPLLADVRAELRGSGIAVRPDHWQACITDSLLDMVQAGDYDKAREVLKADLLVETTCSCAPGACERWEEKKALASRQSPR